MLNLKSIKLCFLLAIVLLATSCTPSWKSAVPDYKPRLSAYSKMLSNCRVSKEECQELYETIYGGCRTSKIEKTGRCWDEMTITYH